MIKYYRVTADYRPNNPNKPTYDFKITGDISKIKMKENVFEREIKKYIKKYFEDLVPWLKVYDVEEITERQCKKQIFRVLKIKK